MLITAIDKEGCANIIVGLLEANLKAYLNIVLVLLLPRL